MQSSIHLLLIGRSLKKLIKQPMAPLMGFLMSLFFLLVYNAGIGGVGFLKEFGDAGYYAFIFPVTIISLAMGSSSGAGQTLFNDMQSGYFKRMFLSPVPRYLLVLSPIIADLFSSLLFTFLMLLIGALTGLHFQFSLISWLGVMLISLLWSLFLCALSAGIMVRTGQPQSVSALTSIIFSMLFLSTTFMPAELIKAKWLLLISKINPVTYALEGIRNFLGGTASFDYVIYAVLILGFMSLLSVIFALCSTRKMKI
ncbi:MAG: ABC transporter permease [Candidatus Cloacimonetes bacterium]|nr:ABC transporter permease [Candidatus Cloacimonadota bacterium]